MSAEVRQVAVAYYRQQATAAQLTVQAVARAWSGLDPKNLSGSYVSSAGPAMVSALSAGQQLAASTAQPYTAASVAAQNSAADPAGTVVASAFSGTAADGRPLASLLYLPVIGAKLDIAQGASIDEALASGLAQLETIVDTEVADAGRLATSVAMTNDRTVHGYVRMVSGSACSRCIILAGKWYRYNANFERHPRCHCSGIPAVENAPDLRTDPHAFFDHLSKAEQDARFGAADAEAIRSGADIFQVVNARRGLYTAGDVYGHSVQATHEGVTRRGLYARRAAASGSPKSPVRLSVAEIYRQAGDDRETAIRLLKKYAYIL